MAGNPLAPEFDLDTRDLRNLGQDLRHLQGGGRASLTRYSDRFKVVAEREMIPALRNSVESLPSKGQSRALGKPSLRKATANAIMYSVKIDNDFVVSGIRVNPQRMNPRSRFSGFLPSYMEGIPGFTIWRHPNWGRRDDPWSRQPATPWMSHVVSRYTPAVIRAVEDQSERAVNQAVQGRRGKK